MSPDELQARNEAEVREFGRVLGNAERKIRASRDELRGIASVLLSEPGRKLLEYLEREFYHGSLIGPTEFETHVNLGKREVVRFIMDLRDFAQKED